MALKTEKPFVAAGSVEMQLDGGNYEIRAASGDLIRVSFGGNTGSAAAEITTAGTRAKLSVKDTPHNHFKAIIEVPQTCDLVVHRSAGNLEVGAINGNTDVESSAGNIEIAAGNPSDYSRVDASVTAGNLAAGPFGKRHSGISNHVAWPGSGKHTLHVNLEAGNLELTSRQQHIGATVTTL